MPLNIRSPLIIPVLAAIALLGAGSFAAAVLGEARDEAPAAGGSAASGVIEVTITLEAGPEAAARTWLFEVVDASGSVVERLSIGTSGSALSASKQSSSLPYGSYSVRQVLNADDQVSCGPGALFAVTSPSGGVADAPVRSPVTGAGFVVAVCDLPRTVAHR